ncbi:hypothetical protein DRP05_05385 [Archaeoglobales archaeon]|nr:MAG: hypothetical protein DRP05_05385 [Archaeoglobales archaeon]
MQLVAEEIRLSNPSPEAGESIKVHVKIYNSGEALKNVWVFFYWVPELIFNNQQLKKYLNPEYEIHKEFFEEFNSNTQKTVTFDWTVKEGFKGLFVYAEIQGD